jgi:RNA polymerase sigma-70 factor (ECF subfamily)
MSLAVVMEKAFRDALVPAARERFDGTQLAPVLEELRRAATETHPDLAVEPDAFAGEIARRLGAAAAPEQLVKLHAADVHLTIACATGDTVAIRRFEQQFFGEIAVVAARMRARSELADEVRGYVRRVLFVTEPGRPAAVTEFSGRGDLRNYLRVIATRELVRVVNKDRREVGIPDEAVLDLIGPAGDPQLDYLRDRYRAEVVAALRAALASLADEPRALLRYSLVDGWTVDQLGALYGIHRTTAARRVTAARDALGEVMRRELAARLSIELEEVDSIVRLVQSRIEASIERLLA